MSTRITRNRTKGIETTEGTALVVLQADEARQVVTGFIQWRGKELVNLGGVDGNAGGVGREALRHLGRAILEAVDASEWEPEAVATEEPPVKPKAASLAELGLQVADKVDALNRGIGDRNKDQAAPVGHKLITSNNGDPVCSCGWVPRFAVSQADGARRVRNHVLNPAVDDPAGRPIADRPQA